MIYTALPNFQTYQGTFTYFLHVIVSSLHFLHRSYEMPEFKFTTASKQK